MIYIIIGSILLLIVIIFAVINLCIADYMASKFTKPHYWTREAKRAENDKDGISIGTEVFERKETTFVMKDGYVIHGDISINNPKKFVILFHGHSSTREASIKYAKIFYPLGYSLILFDQRSHGDNIHTYVTMGYRESIDANEIINQVKERYGQDIEIGCFGVSMGGATALLLTQYRQDLKFIVADCPYACLKDEIKGLVKHKKVIPWAAIVSTNIVLKCKYHFSLKQVEPYRVIQNNEVPTLFIHGAKDDFVLPSNHTKLVANNKGIHKEYLFPNGTHGKCLESDPKLYYSLVKEFISSLN